MEGPEQQAAAVFLIDAVRSPFVHFDIVSDFANVLTTRRHEVLLEPPQEQVRGGSQACLCARAQAQGKEADDPSLATPSSLRWNAKNSGRDVQDGADRGQLQVRCRGCPQMTVFHLATPKRRKR